jgi:hypothetical protein
VPKKVQKPTAPETDLEIGVDITWSTPFDLCTWREIEVNGVGIGQFYRDCKKFEKERAEDENRFICTDRSCIPQILEKFQTLGSDQKETIEFQIGLFPIDLTLPEYITTDLDEDKRTIINIDIDQKKQKYSVLDSASVLPEFMPDCKDKIICAIENAFIWSKCDENNPGTA